MYRFDLLGKKVELMDKPQFAVLTIYDRRPIQLPILTMAHSNMASSILLLLGLMNRYVGTKNGMHILNVCIPDKKITIDIDEETTNGLATADRLLMLNTWLLDKPDNTKLDAKYIPINYNVSGLYTGLDLHNTNELFIMEFRDEITGKLENYMFMHNVQDYALRGGKVNKPNVINIGEYPFVYANAADYLDNSGINETSGWPINVMPLSWFNEINQLPNRINVFDLIMSKRQAGMPPIEDMVVLWPYEPEGYETELYAVKVDRVALKTRKGHVYAGFSNESDILALQGTIVRDKYERSIDILDEVKPIFECNGRTFRLTEYLPIELERSHPIEIDKCSDIFEELESR